MIGHRLGARGLRAFLLCLCLLALSGPAAAQEPERTTELVYGVNTLLGNEYKGVFYPERLETLFLTSNATSIVSPRITEVYYWAITNREVADWNRRNEPVGGTLEIRRRGQMAALVQPTDYVIQYPTGKGDSRAELYLGEEAQRQWRLFEESRDAFRRDVSQYYNDLVNYRQDLDDRIAEGELTEEPAPPPLEPEPFVFSSTEINRGYPIDLPAGQYTMRVRSDSGDIVPGTRRRLTVLAPVSQGVAYAVIPHDRYTFPEQSDDEGEVMYFRADARAYLQPFAQEEYRDEHITRILEPQDTSGRPDLYQWHQVREIEGGTIVLVKGGEIIQRVPRRPYAVRQITGAALGYEIHDQTTTELERLRERRPNFHGFLIDVRELPDSFHLHLEDDAGNLVPGSQRRVSVVRTAVPPWQAALPYLPLMGALLLTIRYRRRYHRLPREME